VGRNSLPHGACGRHPGGRGHHFHIDPPLKQGICGGTRISIRRRSQVMPRIGV
jgi:hypothetical protein